MSRHHGVNVIGVIGFPALERAAIYLNYRDRELNIAPDRPKQQCAE